MRQEDYLKATVGEPQFYKVCTAAFVCGTPNGVEIQGDLLIKPDFEKSKALLKEAGYDGTPVVLMQSTTLPVLTNMAPVTKSLLEQGGFKVDMQSMDWQTVVTRRAKKDPADKGGWSAFHTYAIAADILNPISANWMVADPDKAWFGWPNDPEMEKLRDAYARETDPAKSKALAAGGAEPRARDGAVWLARHVVRPGRRARQRRRLAEGAGDGALEHREEVTPRRRDASDVRAPDGTRLAVYEWGNPAGPEVVLIHGFAQCHLCFEPQIRSAWRGTAASSPSTMRGHGASEQPADPAAYQGSRVWADDIAAVIAAKRLAAAGRWSAGRWADA